MSATISDNRSMRPLFLLGLIPTLFAAMAAPAHRPAGRHAYSGQAPTVEATPTKPARQARPLPARIPDYPAFAETAEAHSALWEITYRHGAATPYTARHRVVGHAVATSDLDLLGHLLSVYEPPHPARAYLDHGPGAHWWTCRVNGNQRG